MKPAINIEDLEPESGGAVVGPDDADLPPNRKLGPFEGKSLGDPFGLTQFGASLETLPPGSKSSMRHWHTGSDELVMMVEGELILVTDEGETTMTPGMIAGFKAGAGNGHHLINRSTEPASFVVVGARVKGDQAHYPDDDFQWLKDDDGTFYAARKDGSRY